MYSEIRKPSSNLPNTTHKQPMHNLEPNMPGRLYDAKQHANRHMHILTKMNQKADDETLFSAPSSCCSRRASAWCTALTVIAFHAYQRTRKRDMDGNKSFTFQLFAPPFGRHCLVKNAAPESCVPAAASCETICSSCSARQIHGRGPS